MLLIACFVISSDQTLEIKTVERAFSAMKIFKNRLRNRMGNQWMNDCLVTYIENDIFKTISNEKNIQR